MHDFDATLNGNELAFHDTVVTLNPLLAQLNATLAIVYADTHGNLAALNANTDVLSPEVTSAVSQPGTDGQGNVLRQYLVVNNACSHVTAKPDPACKTGAAPPQSNAAPPQLNLPLLNLPFLNLPQLQQCLPKPSVPALPTPSLKPLPCPSISALPTPSPCVPLPSTPTPRPLPVPTPSPSLCPSLPGLPIGAQPDWLRLLLGERL
jgi:hypothetical protein